jgi:bacterial/archaeal transporter family protein
LPTSPSAKAKWFWYSILCVIAWGAWALLSKLGSNEIPPRDMQFLFTVGTLPVAFAILAARRFRLEKNAFGVAYSVSNGVLSAAGMMALFAAYRSGGNTSVITAAAALYPMITVALAVVFLHERVTRIQIAGLVLAAAAIVIFSL